MQSSTHWSLIVKAQGDGPGARAALGDLIRRYQKSVLALIRYRKHPPDQTPEDLCQEFFTQILQRRDLDRLDEAEGHFRGWLKVAVGNFLINEWKKWHTAKRGNGLTEPLVVDAAHGETPEHVYLAAFAADTLAHALAQLREESLKKPSWTERKFDAMKVFLPGPDVELDRQAAIALELGMARTTLTTAICRLRQRLTELLRAAVEETLDIDRSAPGADETIDRELALLCRDLCEIPGG
jgi:DNA-directed RNA polymerase specialized sigma24 family protein